MASNIIPHIDTSARDALIARRKEIGEFYRETRLVNPTASANSIAQAVADVYCVSKQLVIKSAKEVGVWDSRAVPA